MAKLYLVRHSESIANAQTIYQGQTYDTALSEKGIEQLQSLKDFFEDKNIDKIIASPLKRTAQTAEFIANFKELDIEYDDRLMETDHGDWSGMTRDEIVEKYPDDYELWKNKPSEIQFPNGENMQQEMVRIQGFLSDLDKSKDTVAVTHGNIIQMIITYFLGREIDRLWEIEPCNASVSILNMNENGFEVEVEVYTKHLDGLKTDVDQQAM